MRHELFIYDPVLHEENEKTNNFTLQVSSKAIPQISVPTEVNPSPFKSQNSFIIEPGEIMCVVYSRNNKLFPQLFQPPQAYTLDYPGPQECLILCNNSDEEDICVPKNFPLLLILSHKWLKYDIQVIHIFTP